MKIAELFSIYPEYQIGEDPLKEVTGIAMDARQVLTGNVFVATKGAKTDGHNFIRDAIEKGAIGLIVSDRTKIPSFFRGASAVDTNPMGIASRIAAQFYKHPAKNLFCVGVTGTNGKTSTTYLVESILNQFGMKTGVMGTINHHIGDVSWQSDLTTPDPVTLQKRLSEFRALGAKAAVFEVSSHALAQGRAENIPFDVALFTNLTRDHLDYHKTMEEYFAAKEHLFRNLLAPPGEKQAFAILNANDEWAMKVETPNYVQRWTFGEVRSDFQFQITEMGFHGTRFRLKTPRGECEVQIQLPGRHNVFNAVGAMAVGLAAGASIESVVAGVEKFAGVPGRLERVSRGTDAQSITKGPFVFVDYAHTDDALKTVLETLDRIRKHAHAKAKIITVFGCGGDRDKGKRPMMAKAAVENSDFVVVTSDNPRSENPMAIIQDILSGISQADLGRSVFVEVDRREAIRKAISIAGPTDVILIAGKGHEAYQIIGDQKFEFSDQKVAADLLT